MIRTNSVNAGITHWKHRDKSEKNRHSVSVLILILYLAVHVILILYLLYILVRLAPLVLYARQPLPFIPINRRAAKRIARLPELQGVPSIIDLGCGTGSLLATISQTQPQAKLIGIDTNAKLIRLAKWRSSYWRHQPTWMLGDMFHYPIHGCAAIVGWWVPEFSRRLLPKLVAECQPGCVIISYMFALPEHPAFTHRTEKSGRDLIHIYRRV